MASNFFETVTDRLKNGVPDLSSPFDPRAKPIYLIVALMVACTAILVFSFGFEIKMEVWKKLPFAALPLALFGMILRRYGHPNIGGTVEVVSLVYLQGLATVLVLFPLTAMSNPFADDLFANADAALGFHWPTAAHLLNSSERAYWVLGKAYGSFEWQTLVIIPALFVAGKSLRAWQFVTASAIAAIIAVAIYPFVPGHGPAIQYGLRPEDYPVLGQFPWKFGPDMQLVKDGLRVISLNMIFGMVSLPSYHAASAAMFLWAAWPVRTIRIPFLILNIVMIPATIVIGVHYLIDVIAGIAVGCFALVVAQKLVRQPRVTQT